LWDVGFQLSFAATLGLMLYVDPLTRWSKAKLAHWLEPGAINRVLALVSEGLIITIAAQILTLPLLIAYFGQLPLLNLPANSLILPVQPAVMISGIAATVTGMVWPAFGQLFAWIAWLFLHYTVEMVRFFGAIPGAAVPLNLPTTMLIAIYILIGGLTWLMLIGQPERKRWASAIGRKLPARAALAGSVVIALLVVNWSLTQPDGYLHVVFLEMDEGEATLIQTPNGRQLLINGGRSPDRLNEQLGEHLPFWDRSLDLIAVTEPVNWLAGGLVEAIGDYDVDKLLTNGQLPETGTAYAMLLDTAAEEQIEVHTGRSGELVHLGDGVYLEVIDASAALALRLVYGDFSLLLPGTLSPQGIQPAVVLKATGEDHGQTSFLQMARPQVVVVTADAVAQSEQSNEEWTINVHDAGAAALFAAGSGMVEVVSDGRLMWWSAEER
jgi:competence protein ComEC